MNKFNAIKRKFLQLLGLAPLTPWRALAKGAEPALTRIAFGSCLHQDKAQPVWNTVLANRPDLFIFLGDNIYGDSDNPAVLAAQYDKLARKPGFQRLRESTEVMAIWDDHGYGRNDAGSEYEAREASRRLMLEFWNEASSSERWSREDGIYTARTFGPEGKRLQVVLLDLRWNRSSLKSVDTGEELDARDAADMGPYLPVDDPHARLLGEAQWQWLEDRFNEPAEFRIIGSSIQLLAEFTGWESWANFPRERDRFLRLLAGHEDVPTVILSGDVHWCELSRFQADFSSRPAVELTSSGLTEVWEKISPNRHRIGPAYATENFGMIDIDWSVSSPSARLRVKDINNRELINSPFPLTATL